MSQPAALPRFARRWWGGLEPDEVYAYCAGLGVQNHNLLQELESLKDQQERALEALKPEDILVRRLRDLVEEVSPEFLRLGMSKLRLEEQSMVLSLLPSAESGALLAVLAEETQAQLLAYLSRPVLVPRDRAERAARDLLAELKGQGEAPVQVGGIEGCVHVLRTIPQRWPSLIRDLARHQLERVEELLPQLIQPQEVFQWQGRHLQEILQDTPSKERIALLLSCSPALREHLLKHLSPRVAEDARADLSHMGSSISASQQQKAWSQFLYRGITSEHYSGVSPG